MNCLVVGSVSAGAIVLLRCETLLTTDYKMWRCVCVSGGTGVPSVDHRHSRCTSMDTVRRDVVSVCQVVQVYLAWTTVTVPVPRWTLVGFNRLTVPLYQPQQQSFVVTSKQMSVWLNDTVGFYIPQGDTTTTTITNNNNNISIISIIFMVL